jgi:hypothetical protein
MLGDSESWMERAWRRALYTRYYSFYVEDGRPASTDNQLESEAWCRMDDELLECRRALYTDSTPIYVGVGTTSAAPDLWRSGSSLV